MNKLDVRHVRAELEATYPDCHVVVAEDEREMVAEIGAGFAVAVIERSAAHFHRETTETYHVLRGTLLVARGGEGHVLGQGDSITIERGQIHSAQATGEPAWLEVESTPPWTAADHFIL